MNNYQQQLEIALRLGIALLGGIAVGMEREWSSKVEGESRFAGVRTFALIGLLGALGVVLLQVQSPAIGTAVVLAAALLIVIAYAMTAFRGEKESTTEFAALMVLAAGALAGSGRLALASALNAFTALLLVEKGRIHSLVYRLQSEELRAGIRFAVLALVVLPLLPEGPYGPDPGIKPRELWAFVLMFSGLSFASFIARRAAGPERGYRLAGFLGGFISSTVVTLNFSRESRLQPSLEKALGFGVIAACTVLPVRVAIVAGILNPAIAIAAIPYLLFPFAVGLILLFLPGFRAAVVETEEDKLPKNPLRLISALKLMIAFQAALYVMKWVTANLGATAILVTAALVGLTDLDTLTFMIAKQNNVPADLAARALAVGLVTNTGFKIALALLIGRGKFRLITSLGLLLMGIATCAGLWLWW